MKTKKAVSLKTIASFSAFKTAAFLLVTPISMMLSAPSLAQQGGTTNVAVHTEYPNNYNGTCSGSPSGNDSELFSGPLPTKVVLKGNKTISCTTVPNTPELRNKCEKMIERVAEFYGRNSRDQLNLSYKASGKADFKFQVEPARHNNNMTWQSQFIGNVANHEFGHKIGLGHSSRTETGRLGSDNKFHYDKSTVLNGHAIGSKYLNSVQYYLKGWLSEDEVGRYDGAFTSTYTLSKLSDFDGSDLSTVVVTPKNYPALFISWPSEGYCKGKGQSKCFTVHYLRAKRATRQLVTQDKGDFCMPEIGLKISMLPNVDDAAVTLEMSRY